MRKRCGAPPRSGAKIVQERVRLSRTAVVALH